ncbi:hypothetical protein TNCV_782471 [Trichonephila clavipes]|nr:hypothetical protein TNCV_782471 [Trichonephila clavipes]
MAARRQKCNNKCLSNAEGLSNAFKQIRCSGIASLISAGDVCQEIFHCRHRRLMHKRFQMVQKKKSKVLRSGERRGNTTSFKHACL